MTKRQRKISSYGMGNRKTGATRRRGTILILVMTVLGLLFVTGVALMATMSFESELIEVARVHAQTRPVIDDVTATIDEFLAAGVGEIIDASGFLVIEQPDTAMEFLSSMPFAQTPGRFNTFSPVEPYYVGDPSLGGADRFVWGWFVDVQALAGQATDYFALPERHMDTAWKSGVDPYFDYADGITPVDADGDGIVDANQVNIELLGFARRQIDPLARVLNARSNPSGSVYLGLRIVPHGGMVNLADAHPSLIRGVFGPDFDPPLHEPYSPLVEEASLRRRGILPPRELPPTQILGSLLSPDPDTGGADYVELYWPRESVEEHRYFAFTPDEFDPRIHPDHPIWRARMDPANAKDNSQLGDEYDRRHLVTSIGHEDQLRRASVIGTGGQRMDIVDWALANNIPLAAFPYLDYPGGTGDFPNTYTGDSRDFDRFDWNSCRGDQANCALNPRKGRLRLSMAWLDEMWDWKELLTQDKRDENRLTATKTIQDAFTLMLLNARGSEWDEKDDKANDIAEKDLNGDRDYNDPGEAGKRIWDPDYDAISKAAAELTANLIDFADDDLKDEPTAVALRNVDFSDAANFGKPLPAGGMNCPAIGCVVYGLEIQPYITEVAATAIENTTDGEFGADQANSGYAIELFNPYQRTVFLSDYFLRIENTKGGRFDVVLSGFIPKNEYKGFQWGGAGISFPRATGLANLDFAGGSTIKLIRELDNGTKIVVDEFDLVDSVVGLFDTEGGDGELNSAQRYATTGLTASWYATVPEYFESGSDTIGRPAPATETPIWQPVEAIIANQGSFSEAFPTTGSLLLLMRYANAEGAAFTSRLSKGDPDPHPIDDGRMPIYDVEPEMFNHLDPSVHPTKLAGGTATRTIGQSGTIEHLPWGQLVFDYFTALPLKNPGPYGDYDGYEVNDPLTNLRKEQPRVDLDGMRAHGRIDINAAPWFVMKGLPFVPMNLVPDGFGSIFVPELGLLGKDPTVAQPIGPVRAQAIAAYRDQRLIRSSDFLLGYMPLSGDYDTDPNFNFGRGWNETAPKIRRGMGFLSIGELANVRHPAAASVDFVRMRFDSGVVGANDVSHQGTYLQAVAALACLSDWVSVRSQVFTAYGTLRGDMDSTIEADDLAVQKEMQRKDVDTRAIRFQETIDRLPTLLGAEEPARIGSRVLATYNDVRND